MWDIVIFLNCFTWDYIMYINFNPLVSFIYFFLFMGMCLHIWIYMYYTYTSDLWGWKKASYILEVIDGWEPPCVSLDLNQGVLQEQ